MSAASQYAYIIRPALPGEAGLLSELALRSKAHWGYSADFMRACRAELTYSAERIEDSEYSFMAVEIAAAIAGFYGLRRLSTAEFELEALFVEPARIGQGVGRALMDHAKAAAAAQGGRSLVIQGDPHAERFYRAAGGVFAGRRESDSVPGRFLPVFTVSLERIGV